MPHPDPTKDYQRIEQAIAYLESRAQQQPTLQQLADHLELSPSHMQRMFQRWAGISPKRFLQVLTLEHARALLEDSHSVLDTALEVGLSGPGRLHDLFVTLEAMTPGEYKRKGEGLEIAYGFHHSPLGAYLLGLTPRGICWLAFVEEGEEGTERAFCALQEHWPAAAFFHEPELTSPVAAQIFGEDAPEAPFRLLVRGTNFQCKVWSALLKIPEGAVCSYGQVASMLDASGGASRAIGRAVGSNPIAYLIPCHRVLRQSGALGGYRWGLPRKRAMLAWESARAC